MTITYSTVVPSQYLGNSLTTPFAVAFAASLASGVAAGTKPSK
jgi:hypothetical protein